MGKMSFILRFAAIWLHALLGFILLDYCFNLDISSSWLLLVGFSIIVLVLVWTFIKHLLSFVQFIKTNHT